MKKLAMVLLLCCALLLTAVSAALADELVLPAGLREIEAETFQGDNSITKVTLPDGLEAIGDRAFSGCTSLNAIKIPTSVSSINENAFEGCSNLTAYVYSDSYALAYCKEQQITYVLIDEIQEKIKNIAETCETISDMIVKYEDSNGFVTASDRPDAIAEVTAYLLFREQQGYVNDISLDDTCVTFHDIQSGLYMGYEPTVDDGSLSGGNDATITIIACEPDKTKKGGTAVSHTVDPASDDIAIKMNKLGIDNIQMDWDDSDVSFDNIKQTFDSNQIILWSSHGNKSGFLNTGVYYEINEWFTDILPRYNAQYTSTEYSTGIHFMICDSEYIKLTIGPKFLDNCKDMSNTFIWLGACHTFEVSGWIDVFRNKNVQAAVGYDNTVTIRYNYELMTATINRMLKINPQTEEYYTLKEAFSFAKNAYGTTDPYKTNDRYYHAEAQIDGDKNYRLIEKCDTQITVKEKPSDVAVSGVSISIKDQEGNVYTGVTDGSGCFKIKLFEGKYTVTLSKDGCEKTVPFTVSRYSDTNNQLDVKMHKVQVKTKDSVTGVTVPEVTITIDTSKNNKYTGVTDKNGCLSVRLFEGEYPLLARKDGCLDENTTITVSPDSDNQIDVEILWGFTLTGKIYDEHDSSPLTSVTVHGEQKKTGYKDTVVNYASSGTFVIKLPGGENEITFSKEGYQSKKITVSAIGTFVERDIYLGKGGEYTITFDGNGGTVSESSLQVKSGEAIGTMPTASRVGYGLVGWNTKSDGKGDAVTAGTVPTANMTVYAIWAEPTADDQFEYYYESYSDSYRIKKYIGTATTVVIPSTYQGKPVTSISLSHCKIITSVSIPSSVTYIDDAFQGCTNLINVTIPNSVTSIYGTFKDCTSLSSVTIPDSVTHIGMYAFAGCTKLTSVAIPNSVTCIGDNTFNSCTSLPSVTIPYSVTEIGRYAFAGCTSLTSVTFQYGLNVIGYGAFYDCTNLPSITIPYSVKSIGSRAFYNCRNLGKVIMPNPNTISMGEEVFGNCKSGMQTIYFK